MPKRALGKGLEALIPQAVMESISGDKIIRISVEDIESNPRQPRRQIDREALEGLSRSIQQDGLLQPVVVRKKEDRFELVMGERRLEAAKLAGVATIPAIVKTVADADSLRLALVENIQRENLNPLDVASAFSTLVESFGLSQEELASMVGKNRSSIANTLRLLNLPKGIQTLLIENKITEGHTRALLSLPTAAEQLSLAKKIVQSGLSVRDTEARAGLGRNKKRADKPERKKPPHIVFLEKAISQHLSTRVSIEEKRGGRGKMIIEFYSHDDFERLSSLMNIPLPR